MTVERKNSRRTRFREGHEGKEKNESMHRQMPFNDKQQWCINTQREGLTVTEHACLLVFCLLNLPICNPIISLLSPSSLLYDQLGSFYLMFVCFPFFFYRATMRLVNMAGVRLRRAAEEEEKERPPPPPPVSHHQFNSMKNKFFNELTHLPSEHTAI